MLSIQEITQSLPPVREDEPASLRREIADEILDHLQCGLRRELLLNGGDEDTARCRVLDKFGDPRQIARRLWYQAMWSKIMAQRLVVLMASFSMLVSIAIVGMMGWMIHRQSQSEAVAQVQNALLLERMAKMIPVPSTPEPQRDLNFNNLKVKVTLDSKDGPPAEGFTVHVSRMPKIGEHFVSLQPYQAKLGKDGIEDCGIVGPGRYQLSVTAPWGEYCQRSFTIFPGRDHIEECIAPAKIPDSTKVSFNLLGIPNENIESNTAFVCTMKPTGSRTVAEHSWFPPFRGFSDRTGTPSLIFVPGHGLFVTNSMHMFSGGDPAMNVRNSSWEPCRFPLECELPDHEYALQFSVVKLLEQNSEDPQNIRWKDRVIMQPGGGQNNSTFYQMPEKFLTAAGQQNQWTASVPEIVVNCVKDQSVLPPTLGGGGMGGMGGGFF